MKRKDYLLSPNLISPVPESKELIPKITQGVGIPVAGNSTEAPKTAPSKAASSEAVEFCEEAPNTAPSLLVLELLEEVLEEVD